jgi:hypothetical protein
MIRLHKAISEDGKVEKEKDPNLGAAGLRGP